MANEENYSETIGADTYLLELIAEKEALDPSLKHASYLLAQEIDRIQNGSKKMIDLHLGKPMKLEAKVRLPAKDYPMINFPGKLLGPKGVTLKQLQDETGTRMMIQGAGSMRDKAKEEELKSQGGKYVHLHHELNVHLESYGAPADCYFYMSLALRKLSAFFFTEFFVPNPVNSIPNSGAHAPLGMPAIRPPAPGWRPPVTQSRPPLPHHNPHWSNEIPPVTGPYAAKPQPRYSSTPNQITFSTPSNGSRLQQPTSGPRF